MIQLKLEQAYEITVDDIALAAGVPVRQIKWGPLTHAVTLPDGRMTVQFQVTFEPVRKAATGREWFHAELDGGLRIAELPFSYRPERSQSETVLSMPVEDGVLHLYFCGEREEGLYVPFGPDSAPQPLEIINPLHRLKPADAHSLAPASFKYAAFDNGVAAVPVGTGVYYPFLAFVSHDHQARTIAWSAALKPPVARKQTLLGRLFSPKQSSLPDATLVELEADDFPIQYPQHKWRPTFYEARLRDGLLYIYSIGDGESPGHGFPFAAIATIDGRGRTTGKPFLQDYTKAPDSKKRGIYGRFSTSGKYYILKSAYQSTDPWGGKQKLFDLDTGQLIDITLPRGYTKWTVIDHAGSVFWAKLEGRPTAEPNLYARFTAE